MVTRIKMMLCAPLLALAACALSPQHAAPAGDIAGAAADSLLAQTLSADGGAGIAAAVMKDGQLIWSGAVGLADIENDHALTPDAVMRIGSVSKPIAAVLTLKYAEQAGIDLDADINALAPFDATMLSGVSLSHLAAHTSGVRHFDFSNFEEANNLYYKATLAEAVAPILADGPLFEPGARFEYSSHGYNIIGAVLEELSGRSFQALVDDYLAAPLSLDQTGIDHPFDIIPGRSRQYTVTMANPMFAWMKDGALINTFYRDSSDYYPSGGMLSSAVDLARFTSAVFETDFLNASSRARITEPAVLANGAPAGFSASHLYSFGWEIRRDEEGRTSSYGHTGATNGAYAVIRYFPDENLAIAGIANYNVMGREPAFFEAISSDLRDIFAAQ